MVACVLFVFDLLTGVRFRSVQVQSGSGLVREWLRAGFGFFPPCLLLGVLLGEAEAFWRNFDLRDGGPKAAGRLL